MHHPAVDAALVRTYLAALPDVPPDEKALERVRFCLSTLQTPDVRYLVATVVGPHAPAVGRVIAAVTAAAGAPTGLLGRSLAEVTLGGAPIDDALLGPAGTLSAASGYQLADTRSDLGELSRRDGTVLLALTAFAEASQRVAVLIDDAADPWDPAHAPRPDLVVIASGDADVARGALALVPDGCPCVVAPVADAARDELGARAAERGIPLLTGGHDHRVEERDGRWTFLVRDDPYVTFDPPPGIGPRETSTGLAAALALGLMGIRMREEWLLAGLAALREPDRVVP